MPQPLTTSFSTTFLITHSLLVSSIYKSSLVIMAASSAMQSILASPLTRVVSNRSTRVNQFLIIPTSYVSPVLRNTSSMRVRCMAKVMKCYLIVKKKKKKNLSPPSGFRAFLLLLHLYLCVLSCPPLLFSL